MVVKWRCFGARLRHSDPAVHRGPKPQANGTDPLWRLWGYLRAYRGRIVLGCLSGLMVSVIMLALLKMIEAVQGAMSRGDRTMITLVALAAVGAYFVQGLFHFGQVYLLSNVAERLAQRLRNEVYDHLQQLPLSLLESRKTGSLIAAITADVPAIQGALTTALMEGVTAPATVLVGVGYMIYTNWRLAAVTLVSLPLMGAAISALGKRMRRASEQIQMTLGETSGLATETLSAIRVVRSFGMEAYESERFHQVSHHTYRANMRAIRLQAALKPVMELLGAISIAFIIWFGGMEVTKGVLDKDLLVAYLYAAMRITTSIQQIGRFHSYLERIRGAAKGLFAVLDTPPDIRDAPTATTLTQVRGHIRFENVYFAYNGGEPVLRGLSFEVRPGEAVALVGASGVGKSTVANLIPRFYDVTSGSILVDGMDVRDVTVRSLRAHIAIVAQEPVLFSGTIRDNIAYGRPGATEEEIIQAAQAANAHDFIMRTLPDGYETLVGERGVKLSGGQRQRIAIARALLKNPRILILDEATSSLDTESEALVQEALETLMKGRTTLIIAHRLSTVRNADRILVLADGRVCEEGPHEELLRRNGMYARLYEVGLKSEPHV